MSDHKRWIIVPNNAEAGARLDLDCAMPGDLVEWELSEEDFRSLWSTGVFTRINTFAHAEIDDYEDTAIRGPKLTLAGDAIVTAETSTDDPGQQALLSNLRRRVDLAVQLGTPIHFFF